MTAKEALMSRVAELSEDAAAHYLKQIDDDEFGPYVPLTDEQKASVRRGLADIAAGRVISQEEMDAEFGVGE